jgi:energy coupling factor transporter S component ThiW
LKIKNMSLMAMLIALGTITAHLVSIPVGVAKVFPMQHAINVVGGVLLGPVNAGIVALLIAILRNMLGVGSLLAFPGGIVGAVLAGTLYRLKRRPAFAFLGEIVGTGVFGALLSYPIAKYVLEQEVLVYAFIVPFGLSSIAGAIIGYLVLGVLAGVARSEKTE